MSEELDPKVEPEIPAVSAADLGKLRDALSIRYGAKLRPGEVLTVDAERSAEQCWARIEIALADNSYQLEVEAAAVPDDVSAESSWDPVAAFELVLDLLDAQLDEYFDGDRFARWHEDWRIYEFEGSHLRFRGREARPDLEALADAWLATDQPVDDGEPN